ncbi:MAG: AmmeMemoRadiSam system radical SAM enzyme [Spirochaetae bacterium HGW-Spirochaetae-3]|jgi:pyruvate formate lyase activating enzyme|nr:MAG: AmmeMemoRadiSam system radical SAM enzyme [Spirochaetae bacterium HGW-Spirochaetae-3]
MPGREAVEALYYEKEPGGFARCSLCPHRCRMAPGATGLCHVRRNDAGRISLPFYGDASALSVDPIEKKPLYHFFPGSSVYSIGYVGCNLHCPFCQNFGISQSTDAIVEHVTPAGLVAAAIRSGCPSIAHTYSEPVVHAEFVEQSMRAARAAGLRNVLVTNGYAGADAATALLSLCDAVNVDIKAWDREFYREELGGDLETVKEFVRMAYEFGVHVEATTLVIPGKNDEPDQVEGIADFLATLSPDIPLHLSAYRPMYRYSVPATPSATVHRLAEVAKRRLRYVYAGNVLGERSITACRACGAVLVSRRGYSVDASGLDDSACASCGVDSPIKNRRKESY